TRLQASGTWMTSGRKEPRAASEAGERGCALPDLHALLRIPVHLVFFFHVERGVKRGLIDDDAVDAKFARAVRIGEDAAAQFIVRITPRPDLCVTQKETLVAREAVDRRRALALQRKFVRAIRHRNARLIRNILAHREIAVDEQTLRRTKAAVFFAELRRAH